jgi:hypothetical protein
MDLSEPLPVGTDIAGQASYRGGEAISASLRRLLDHPFLQPIAFEEIGPEEWVFAQE